MLENLPVVGVEAVEAVKARLRLPDPQEVSQILEEVCQRNPHLVAWLVKAIDVPLELAFDQGAAPEGDCSVCPDLLVLLRHSLIWGCLLTLDLVDRELFAARMAQVEGV